MNFLSDFTKSWPSSDVILVAKDAEGNKQELHATRTYLSAFSSFFESMFSSNFKEANSNSVEVSCSYKVLNLILDILYGLRRNYSKVKQNYDVDVLMELYKAADYLDIPFIRGLCIEQMLDRPSVTMTTAVLGLAASGLDLHDTLMKILIKMNPHGVKKFLAFDNSQLLFSKEDVTVIYKAIAKNSFPKSEIYTSWKCWNNELPDLYEEYKKNNNPPIDYTKKWPWSDVLIKSKNSDGKELYSCKAVLAMVSSKFAEVFSSKKGSENSSNIVEIVVDVDFPIIKNILAIVHQCYNPDDLNPAHLSHCFLIYAMFCAASEDKLNIPFVRDVCTRFLLKTKKEHVIDDIHMDIATKITGAKSYILQNIDADELLDWVYGSGIETRGAYEFNGKKYWVYFTNKKKPVLSLNDVRVVVETLLEEYNE